MFQQKIQNIKEQQKKYLIETSEYHYFIEALLFKIQKSTQGEIEYISNGINRIDIYIVKDKNIKEIRLPYFDKDLQIWKKKLYTIDELKTCKPKRIIDQYIIKIHEVEELNNQNTQELKALKQQIELLQQENQELKSINKRIELLQQKDQELKSINKRIELLQQENQELKALKQQIELLQQENQELKTLKQQIELLQRENQELKSINKQIQQENNNVSNKKKYIADVLLNDDIILHDFPIILNIDNQKYSLTLDQIFAQNFNLKINNKNIEIKPCFQSEHITTDNNNIYYNLIYSKEYSNYVVMAPEPFDQEFKFQLINGGHFRVIKKQNYSVYITVTLQ